MSSTPPDQRDVFEEVFALLTPERLLHDPRATGEGVTVGILDSGVEWAVLEEKFRRWGQEIYPIHGGIFTADRAEPFPSRGCQQSRAGLGRHQQVFHGL